MRTIKALLIGVPIAFLLIGIAKGLAYFIMNFDITYYVLITIVILIVGFMFGSIAMDVIEERNRAKDDESK
jgi:hypothetical protein